MPHQRITQIEDYEPFVGRENVERVREKARKFKGLRVVNFNSTYYGGAGAGRFSSFPPVEQSPASPRGGRLSVGGRIFFLHPEEGQTRARSSPGRRRPSTASL